MDELVARGLRRLITMRMTKTVMTFCRRHLEAMTAAKVLLEAARKTVIDKVNQFQDIQGWTEGESRNALICDIRDKLDGELSLLMAPKTIESRVELRNETNQLGAYASVWLDGKHVITLLIKDAETFRRGLIAEKKEKGCSSK